MLYLANPSTEPIRRAMSEGLLGCIVTPGQGNKLPPPPVAFAIDNGCGPGKAGIGAGYPGDREYLEFLSRMSARARERCLFAVAPDVVCDAGASASDWRGFTARCAKGSGRPSRSQPRTGLRIWMSPGTRSMCRSSAATPDGNSARLPEKLVSEAKKRHKKVHMGRVNSLKRLRYAEAIGCDTADGTYLTFAPDQNLRVVLGWDRAANQQGTLWDNSNPLAPSRAAVRRPPAIHPAARRRNRGTTSPAYGVRGGPGRGPARGLAAFTHPWDPVAVAGRRA